MRLSLDPPLDPGAYPFRHAIRVRFAETDAMGVVHHANYPLYLEQTRVEWMRDLGHTYGRARNEGFDLAVIELFVAYRKPLAFDEVVDVHLLLGRMTRMTFQVGYLLTVDGEVRATAVTVHGCVTDGGRAARMPEWLVAFADAGTRFG